MKKLLQVLGTVMALGVGLVVQPLMGWAKAPAISLSADQQQTVRRINDYLNSYQTLKANFNQVSAKGMVTKGVLSISKPGKLRFDYAGNPLLVVSDGKWLTIEDRQRMRGDQFPLSATPLRLVVSPGVDLLSETDVIAFDSHDGMTSVSIQDKKDNMGGFIILIYDEKLNQLRQWTVVDGKDRRTTVQLSNIEFGGKFDPKMFVADQINK